MKGAVTQMDKKTVDYRNPNIDRFTKNAYRAKAQGHKH